MDNATIGRRDVLTLAGLASFATLQWSSTAEGAVRGLAGIVAAIEQVEQAAVRLSHTAGEGRATTDQIRAKAEHVSGRAMSHASGAEQVTAAAEEQGASTQQMAAAAGQLLQAAEKLRGLVKGFRT